MKRLKWRRSYERMRREVRQQNRWFKGWHLWASFKAGVLPSQQVDEEESCADTKTVGGQ